ncbi:MAG: CDP-alcohol phosphatidyltransferase family protein [Dehalococcoidales bacterium]|nr:CDP-alcohol phosphatidyltransferase family protein [Dehalococcoidales bacterium]
MGSSFHQRSESFSDPGIIKRNLPDFLTVCRLICGLAILVLSLAGRDAYVAVVILIFVGGLTDIMDGRAARRYLGKGREGRLGKHDILFDITFLLCAVVYFSLADIVINATLGLAWAAFVFLAVLVTRRDRRVIIVCEVITVVSLLVITLIYDPGFFVTVVVPVMVIGIFINRRRLMYILFRYWPALFLNKPGN